MPTLPKNKAERRKQVRVRAGHFTSEIRAVFFPLVLRHSLMLSDLLVVLHSLLPSLPPSTVLWLWRSLQAFSATDRTLTVPTTTLCVGKILPKGSIGNFSIFHMTKSPKEWKRHLPSGEPKSADMERTLDFHPCSAGCVTLKNTLTSSVWNGDDNNAYSMSLMGSPWGANGVNSVLGCRPPGSPLCSC